jgi:transcription elongation factor/antiterminator RfaH
MAKPIATTRTGEQPRIGPLNAARRWYLVHTQAGREAIAQINLRRQGYQTFLPIGLRTTRHARKLRTAEAAYFPGYLFVSIDLATQGWRPINGTLGVIRLFATDASPTPVPTGVVEQLIDLADSSGLLAGAPSFAPGDPVRLIAGPFADTLGVVQGQSGHERVRVLLAIMGGEIVMEVPLLLCEAAPT